MSSISTRRATLVAAKLSTALLRPMCIGLLASIALLDRAAVADTTVGVGDGPDEPAGIVSREQAIEAGLARNPELLAAAAQLRAQEGAVRQAALLPNPSLEGETEDLAGTGRFASVSQPQTAVRLSQLVWLGGDRGARVRVATAGGSIARLEYDAKRLEVRARVVQAFVNAQAAQAALAIAEDSLGLSEAVVAAVEERVSAGFASPVEATKVRVAAAGSRVEVEVARQAVEAARRRLAASWGGTGSGLAGVAGGLPPLAPLPTLARLEQQLSDNPDLARWAAEIERREAHVDVEQARAIPDVTLSAGYRRFHDAGSDALIVGASVPLPLFDRNQGGIAEAENRLVGIRQEARAAVVRLGSLLADAYRTLAAVHAEMEILDRDMLPGAQSAYAAAQEGYVGGKFGLLDVLDAQRTLFAARARRVQALANYHRTAADIARLTGRGLGEALQGDAR